MLLAEPGHGDFGAAVYQGILDLVGHHPDAVAGYILHPPGVEVGQRHFPDPVLVPQVGQVGEGVKVAAVVVVPPVELQQVQPVHPHAAAGDVHVALDHLAGHRPGPGHPLGERLDSIRGALAASRGKLAPELADEVFGGAVVVRQVPCGKPGVHILEHTAYRRIGVNGAVSAGNLPHPVEDTANRQIASQVEPAVFRKSHHHLTGIIPGDYTRSPGP